MLKIDILVKWEGPTNLLIIDAVSSLMQFACDMFFLENEACRFVGTKRYIIVNINSKNLD